MRKVRRSLVTLTFGAAVLVAVGVAAATDSQRQVAERASQMIRDKLDDRAPTITNRVRSLVRLSRGAVGDSLLVSAPSSRAAMVSNAAWMLRRDLIELSALKHELALVEEEISEITANTQRPAAPGDLEFARPVSQAKLLSRFGQRRQGRQRISSRGVTWTVAPGAEVRAPRGGRIVVSPTADSHVLVIAYGSEWLVLAPVRDAPAVGTVVATGDSIARCASSQLTLERRLVNARGGIPLDPGNLK